MPGEGFKDNLEAGVDSGRLLYDKVQNESQAVVQPLSCVI